MSQTPTPVTDALRQSGGFNPAWEAMEKLDPAFLESFLAMGMQPRLKGVLDAKTWELIAIAVDASCTHLYAPGVRRHIKGALDAGGDPSGGDGGAGGGFRAGHPFLRPGLSHTG
jgi:alkylhydroperoxidase/carboxymuconolactone decarboxylase family protein YurZ